MKNYQLYKTNILLSGQVQWDLIIGISNGVLYVKDFHLTPVSDYVPYNKYSDDSLLNYEHRFNLKDLYRKISGYFYSTPVNHYMNGDWPLLDKSIQPFDDTYLAGCRRLNYSIYNKPFGYLCPVWLEKLSGDDILSFKININSSNYKIASKVLQLDDEIENLPASHYRFVKYFKDYISYLNIDTGCDDIININLMNQSAYLRGVDVTTGNLNICNLPSIVKTLIFRERPLMEFDSIITNSFKENNCIIPNLFNFNICFDVSDVLVGQSNIQTYGKSLIFEMEAGVSHRVGNVFDFEAFDKNDIYTNFNYIPKKYSNLFYQIDENGNITDNSPKESTPNVLDYLKDDKYIDFMNKNKVVQSICHWQLADNNDYIFNLYDGFSGYVEDGEMSHLYANTPDLMQNVYNKNLNNMGWAAKYNIDYSSYIRIISNFESIKNTKHSTRLGRGWNNNVYYNYDGDKYVHVVIGYVSNPNDLGKILNSVDGKKCFKYVEKNTGRTAVVNCLGYYNDFLFICSNEKDLLTFAGIKDVLNGIIKSNHMYEESPGGIGTVLNHTYYSNLNLTQLENGEFVLNTGLFGKISDSALVLDEGNAFDMGPLNNIKLLYNILKSVKSIPMVVIDKSLHILLADSPSLSTNEVEYYKNDNPEMIYILRYDGKIKPCFGYGYNEIYYKKYINPSGSESDNPIIKYSNKGYPPYFKSIGFYAYDSIKIDYNEPNKELVNGAEYKWFNKNQYLNLPGLLEFNIHVSESEYSLKGINNKISDELMKMFDQSKMVSDYILTKYNINYNLLSFNDDKSEYEYKINLILK